MSHVMDRPIVSPWWRQPRMRALGMAGALLLVLAAGALALRASAERRLTVPRADVTIGSVTRGTFHDFVPLHGTVVPKDTVYLDALAGGQVEKLLVQAGDAVTAGQPLIVFRNEQLQLEVLNNEGRLVESITQLQTFETQLEANRANNATILESIRYNIATLEHTAARYDPLLKAGAIAPKDVEQVHDQLAHYRALLPVQIDTNRKQEALRLAQLPGLQASEKSLQESLVATHRELDNLTVRAPVSGRITALDLKIGENRNRGERLAEITPPTGFKISADIDEYYLGRVKTGQHADIDLNGARHALRIARIYPEVKNGVFKADLGFEGAMPVGLSPGATADGKLSLGGDSKGLVLPSGAFLEASGGDYVFVLDANGHTAHRRRIKLGRRNLEQVEILSGLQPGDRVITSDYSAYGQIDRIDLAG
jgi:HlyD family secretion protein